MLLGVTSEGRTKKDRFCEWKCAWSSSRVRASSGEEEPRREDERQPEWCSPLQQLSATEQKIAPRALCSNSWRAMEGRGDEEEDKGTRREKDGGYK